MVLKRDTAYLLSDQRRVMCCLHLERAVVGPKVDRVSYAGAASLVNLYPGAVSSVSRPRDPCR
jgi:hypothetical protein